MEKYLLIDFEFEKTFEIIGIHKLPIALIIIFIILHIISYKNGNLRERLANMKTPYWYLFLVAIIFPILILYGGDSLEFMYFQF